MIAVPADIPVTTPLIASTIAIDGALLLQPPPGVASDNGSVTPAQTVGLPDIAAGSGFTVITIVAVQPAGSV